MSPRRYNSDRVLSHGVISHDEAKKNYKVNPTVKAMIDDIQAKYKADSSKVVIENSPVKLSGDRMDVRVRETNLGNVVADALLDYGQSAFTHKSNLAVTNGGGLRETIAKDKPITKGDIIAVLPFGNSVAQIQVTGQNIHDMFVKSLGSILQVDESGKTVLDENGQPLLEPSGGSFKSQELVFTMTQLFQLKNVSCQLTFLIQKLAPINHSTLMKLTTL